jgi:type I restriction enzyme M protein
MAEEAKKTTLNYVDEIWNIADYVRDVISRADYNKLVLPFSLLRRLECALESTREDVVKAVKEHEAEWGRESDNYCQYSKKAFYNVTSFRLNNLGASDTYDALDQYINGFSPNAREIMLKFEMENTCKRLQDKGMLYSVCQKFAALPFDSETVSDREMSDIYEHLIQRYGDEIAEDAEDFMTPKDIVRLATGMIFANDDELMSSDTGIVRTLYDQTIGTGGFVCDALELLDKWHEDKKMKAPAIIVPYGEELSGVTWAMAKANLLIRNVSDETRDAYDSTKDLSAHILEGDTLSDDKFPDTRFDYCISNPPYGKKWEKEKSDVETEAAHGFAGRFGAGTPSISDGSMLFIQNMVAHMKTAEEGGSKAGIVLSASPLFNGDAGSGPSNIRRWLFERDLVDCIVKIGQGEFFRTGINTYLWILSTKKPDSRKGMIQLIDASDRGDTLRKSQGNKRIALTEDDMNWIIKTYIDGHDDGKSVMIPKEDFMFRAVTVQRPLKMVVTFDLSKWDSLFENKSMQKLSDGNKSILKQAVEAHEGETVSYDHWVSHADDFRSKLDSPEVAKKAFTDAFIKAFGVKTENDEDIVRDKKGNPVPDPDLKDTEKVPYLEDIDDYMEREVLPYVPDAWVDETVVDNGPLADGKVGVVGTQISFDKYFYHYEAPRDPAEIMAEIKALEPEIEDALKGVFE